MAEVHVLPGVERRDLVGDVAPVGEVIDALERALVEARRGEVRAVAIALVRAGGLTGTSFAADPDGPVSHPLMAAISYLQYRYAQHKVDDSEVHEHHPDAPA